MLLPDVLEVRAFAALYGCAAFFTEKCTKSNMFCFGWEMCGEILASAPKSLACFQARRPQCAQ